MRRGFTLAELIVVLAILSISAAAAAPALAPFLGDGDLSTTDALAAVLRTAQGAAVKQATSTAVLLAPASGRYSVRVAGLPAAEGVLPLPEGTTLESTEPRVRFDFTATGLAVAGQVFIREGGRTVVVDVDRWTGEIRVRAP